MKEKKVTLSDVQARALSTSKQYEREVGLWSTHAFLVCLGAKRTNVKGTFWLEEGRTLTVAQNTTGRGETIRIFSASGKEVIRVFFSSDRFKFPNMISLGKPARKKLEEHGFSVNNLTEHHMHKGSYIFTPDFDEVWKYLVKVIG